MKVFSMFSGIGGFDLAAKRLGYEIIGACEIDKYARLVYERHFPNVPMWQDATKLRPEELPDFEMLCAGFPCQAFSNAGHQNGLNDARGTLFYEITRIAEQKRPRYLFLENVMGLLGHDENRTILTFLKILNELGYDVQWQGINGKNWLPQNRPRLFFIGHLRGTPRPKVFPLGEIDEISFRTPKKTQEQEQRLRNTYTRTIDKNYSKGGGSRTHIALMSGHQSQNGRKWNDYAFALTTRLEQYIADGVNVRVLTPLECERLQGFPDNWTQGLSDSQRRQCIGNAVMVPCVEEIMSKLSLCQ